MPRQTPRMYYPYPAEGDDPFFDYFRQFTNDVDAADFAYADNDNIIGFGMATFSWDATSSLLSWSTNFYFSGFTTGYRIRVDGPSTVTIQDGYVFGFVMPRLITQGNPSRRTR